MGKWHGVIYELCILMVLGALLDDIVVWEHRNTWILPRPTQCPSSMTKDNDEWTQGSAWLVQSLCLKLRYKAFHTVLGWNAEHCPQFRSFRIFLSSDPHLRILPPIHSVDLTYYRGAKRREGCLLEEAKRKLLISMWNSFKNQWLFLLVHMALSVSGNWPNLIISLSSWGGDKLRPSLLSHQI